MSYFGPFLGSKEWLKGTQAPGIKKTEEINQAAERDTQVKVIKDVIKDLVDEIEPDPLEARG